MSDPSEAQPILDELVKVATEISEFLGTDPAKHGMLRGTAQMALLEAQGCGIEKFSGTALPSASLQSTAGVMQEGSIIGRSTINNTFNHFISLRDTTNALVTRLNTLSNLIGRLTAMSPDAGRVARVGYQPLLNTTAQRIQMGQQVEQAIVEITNSGNANRLSEVVITETGRDEAALAETQLAKQGVQMLPNAIANGRNLMQQISRLPLNAQEAEDMLKDIATKGSAGIASIATAARAGGAVARSWVSAAIDSVGVFLVEFGSRLVTPIIIIGPMPGSSDKGA